MHQVDPPTFEDWRHYCFTLGYADFCGTSGDADEIVIERVSTYRDAVDPITLARYLTRLFNEAGSVVDKYTPGQVADATWFLFGVGSDFFHAIRNVRVPNDLQALCYKGVSTIYTDLFDRLCNLRGTLAEDCSDSTEHRLDGAVYMIWDMDCISGAVMFGETHLYDPAFGTLETVLDRCETASCLKSALHGLGHIYKYHPDRVESIIKQFLHSRENDLPQWLVQYAKSACRGAVL